MMKKILCLALALLLLPLSGCAAQESIAVAASFYPVYVLAQNVLKDVEGVTLSCLAAPSTGCLHDYQLLAGDMRALAEADAFLICGAGMEGYLDAVTAQLTNLPVVDCSAGIALIAQDHDEETEDHENDQDDHHHAYNAHVWLDPMNAAAMVRNMAEGLGKLLPDKAEQINGNAQAYIARLTALDTELRQGLSGLKRRDIVTFHEAFPYFAKAYDLNVVAVVALEPDESLSPQMLSQLVTTVRDAGNPPLFVEPQYDDKAAKAVAQETGAKIFELDPLVTGEGDADAYERGMRQNLAALLQALGE